MVAIEIKRHRRLLVPIAILLHLLCTLSAISQTKGRPTWVTVNGRIYQTESYCGGAKPSDEQLQILNTPRPLGAKTLYIKIGRRNANGTPIYRKVVTDEQGRFQVKLKAGTTYCFVEDWKGQPFQAPQNTEFVTWDLACLKDRYATPDFVLAVKKGKNHIVKITYHKPCFYRPYCGQYSGPLPP